MKSPLCLAVFFAGLLQFVNSQNTTFQWDGTPISTAGPAECENVPIQLSPLTTGSTLSAVAPYYMISFELGGIAMTDFLGTDLNNLSWTVRHAQGTTILLYVVDSVGNMGIPHDTTVQSGNTTNCHPTSQTSSIRLTTDSSQVATCDELTFGITGGTTPYIVSVVGVNVTNVTLSANDNQFTYVNRIAPGDSFIVTASDAKGNWATGTNLLSSFGSTDTSCPGKESFGSQSNSTTPASSSGSSSNKGPIIGGVIAGVVVVLAAVGLAIYFYLKRRKDKQLSATNSRAVPFDEEDISPYVINEPQMQKYNDYPSTYTPSFAMTEQRSEVSETPWLRDPNQPLRVPTAMTVGGLSSISGSIHGGHSSVVGAPERYPSTEQTGRGSMYPAGLLNMMPPTTSKQRLAEKLAREEAQRRGVVQHDDAEDVMDVPPIYRERPRAGNVASGSG